MVRQAQIGNRSVRVLSVIKAFAVAHMKLLFGRGGW
jgi:hypothetical protein